MNAEAAPARMEERPASAPLSFTWTARTGLVLALGGLAVALAFLLRAPAALTFAVPLLLSPLAAYGLRPASGTVARVTGSVEGTSEPMTVGLAVELRPAPRGMVEARLDLPRPLRAVGSSGVSWSSSGPRSPGPRWGIVSDWPTVCRIDPPALRWTDPLGLASSSLPVQGDPIPYERPPAGARHLASTMVQRLTHRVGFQRAPLPAPQGEFHSVRPFQVGDGLRQINWRATARRGDLISNSFLAEVPPRIVLAMDVGPWPLPDGDAAVMLGVARAGAHALASQLIRLKTQLGGAVLEPFPRWVALGTGQTHLRELQQLFQSARLGVERPPAERYAIALQRAFPPRSAVVLFGPSVEEEMVALGFHLRRAGLTAYIVAPSPIPLARPRAGPATRASDLGFRVLRLSRVRELGRAWQWGPAVDWEDLASLASLTTLFRRPAGPGGAGRG